ncbi:MAG: ABC transporter substrate-binding protein [Planctomycetota bacterium]|nr:ABC transporter substrate-binding protein [Planctomycetota bacterium]
MKTASANKSAFDSVNVGFVSLIDAAPIIVALELGYFVDEAIEVALHRQIGWGNVRDKLTFGHLDASHALLGMAPLSVLGKDMFGEPLVAIASLGKGGNAITLRRRLIDIGITSPAALQRHIQRRDGKPLVFAHVFSCSTHHYLLRDWLSSAGIRPDKDIHLCALPPSQMVRQLGKGLLDGFCVGEPWGVVAESQGVGGIIAATTELSPNHPEKVLAVSRKWLGRHSDIAERLVRAVLRGCAFCNDGRNNAELCKILSALRYLDKPPDLLAKSLALAVPGTTRRFRDWSAPQLAPDAANAAWLLRQMVRWGHLPADTKVAIVAEASVDPKPYLAASESLKSPRLVKEHIPIGVK